MEITLQPTAKQHQAYQILEDHEHKFLIFGGGAGGGKSWLGCEWKLIDVYRYPGIKSYIARNELKRLMTSTFVTWNKVCKMHKIPKTDWRLNGQYNYIEFRNGSRIDLLDVAFKPGDPLFERFGSTEYTNGWLEEAGEIDFLAFDVLKSRVGRHMNKEYNLPAKTFITCNPKKNWLYDYYKMQKEGRLPPEYAFLQSLYGDNPHTAQIYGEQLASIKDQVMRMRLKDGIWEYDDDPTALIDYDSIRDIFTVTIDNPDKNNRYLICDVARFGRDTTVVMIWDGFECIKIFQRRKQDTELTKEWIKDLLREYHIPYSHCVIDEDGVGGGVLDGLKGAKGFVANRIPFDNPETKEPDNFSNLKAQCGYKLADMVCGHMISVRCDDIKIKEELIAELEWLKSKDADNDGKRKLLPKEEIKEALGRSPDFSDCLLMRMYFVFDKIKKVPKVINKPRTPYVAPSPFGG